MKHKETEEQNAIPDSEHEIETDTTQTETPWVGVGQPEVGRAEIDIEEVAMDFEMLTTEQKETVLKIISMRQELEVKRDPIQSLRNIPTKEVKKELKKLNDILDHVQVRNITELNDTFYVCARLVTQRFERTKLKQKEPPWRKG